MSITPEQMGEWKRLCEAATPGPWEAKDYGSEAELVCGRGGLYAYWIDPMGDFRAEDARFIAASRTALPALLAEVERLERRLYGERGRPTTPEAEAQRDAAMNADIAKLLEGVKAEARAEERAAVVAHLRELDDGYPDGAKAGWVANAIERGEHLPAPRPALANEEA